MISAAAKIGEYTKSQNYEQAYLLGKRYLEKSPGDPGVLAALRELTAVLRSKCLDMAAKKQDCTTAYLQLEDLLSQTNGLTGQDMYGR